MLIQLNNQHMKSGQTNFIIDSVFKQTNFNIPKGKQDTEMHPESDATNDQAGNMSGSHSKTVRTRSTNSTDFHLSAIGDCSTEDGSATRPREDSKHNSPTQIMFERYNKSNALSIPMLDQKDIVEENPLFNNNRKSHPEHQQHPEFTQSSYLRLKSLEEAFAMTNYLTESPKSEKLSLSQRISNTMSFSKKDGLPKD